MNAIERLEQWHDMIIPDVSQQEIDELGVKMLVSEIDESLKAGSIGSLVKEFVDVMVVAKFCMMNHSYLTVRRYAEKQFDLHQGMIGELGIDPMKCLEMVNESNFSKLIRSCEIDAASDHFAKLGIDVEIVSINDEYLGCYSSSDQVVGVKTYEANKLMKGPNYSAIDESKYWWK